jgi:hypothetical protein
LDTLLLRKVAFCVAGKKSGETNLGCGNASGDYLDTDTTFRSENYCADNYILSSEKPIFPNTSGKLIDWACRKNLPSNPFSNENPIICTAIKRTTVQNCTLGQVEKLNCVYAIPNSAEASKIRTCNPTGIGYVYGECILVSCKAGFNKVGNECVAQADDDCFDFKNKSLNEYSECLLNKMSEKNSYSFAQLSDPHLSISKVNGVNGAGYREFKGSFFEKNLNNAQKEGVSFVIVTGDMLVFSNEENLRHYYDNVLNFMKTTKIPVFNILGNHEFFMQDLERASNLGGGRWGTQSEYVNSKYDFLGRYFYYMGDTDYTFTYGPVRFLMINTVFNAMYKNNYRPISINDVHDKYAKDTQKFAIRISNTDETYALEDSEIENISNIPARPLKPVKLQ